jgi:MFS family permease
MTSRLSGLWRHSDFMKFWTGQTISVIGTGITALALPLIAADTLNATPEQMGVLSATGQLAYLVISLPAGAWIDRVRRRPVMVLSDIGRALCLAAIPVLGALNLLGMEALYIISLISGVMTVFFELAYLAFVPVLVSREHVVEANAKLETSRSAVQIVGPGLAGVLVQWLGAPLAIVVDAFSFALSAVSLMLIRMPETAPENGETRKSIVAEISEGVRVVAGHPVLRTLTLGVTLFNFFATLGNPILFLFLIDDLHLEAAQIGLIFSIAAPGTLLGALLAQRITERIGIGRAIALSLVVGPIGWLLLPLAQLPAALAIGMIALGEAILGAAVMVFNINVLSLRQSITPDRLLGRVAATQRFLVFGVLPIASLLGGLLGGSIGLRPTLYVSVVGSIVSSLVLLLSPVVRLRTTAQAVAEYGIK